jgi:hypothetical protein
MERDDQNRPVAPPSAVDGQRRALAIKLAALCLFLVSATAATGFFLVRSGNEETAQQGDLPPAGPRLFRDWPKPDLALLVSGEQHGYLQPCGCSPVQYGGLARRNAFLQTLTKRGWPVVAADVGDIAQDSGPQAKLKYAYSLKVLKQMGYTAVGIGKNEINLPLVETLAEILNIPGAPQPLLANLKDEKKNFADLMKSWEISKGDDGTPKVGFVGVIGPALAKKLANSSEFRFDTQDKVLPGAIRELQANKAELLVLLYQGNIDEAKACAQTYPQFHVILHTAEEPEPSDQTVLVGSTMLVNVGKKGRFVGVVGVNRTDNAERPFELRYQLVELDPSYETPEGKEKDNFVHALMEEYAQTVRDGKYLEQYPYDAAHPLQLEYPEATYVGSGRCQSCHKSAYKVWKEHPHSHAYDTLVTKAKRPSLRQFDGECLICHTTGFGYKTGFRNEKDNPKLINVGCESCHGPASLHVANEDDKKIRSALNPFKARPGEDPKKLDYRIFDSCVKCHDTDNSVNFTSKSFPAYLKKTFHTLDAKK